MMHIEEGEKHSFWADSLPAGLSVVRQFDKIVMAIWVLCLIGYTVAFAYLNSNEIMGHRINTYDLLACIAIPFAIVGLIYILDRRNLVALIISAVMAVLAYVVTQQLMYVLLMIYLFFGALGVACIVDAIERIIFYKVVAHIRYVNVKEHLGIVDRICAFAFNVPPDLDTRNISIEPRVIGNKFPWKDMGSTVLLSLIVGMFFWIYFSMNPSFMSTNFEDGVPMFIFGITLYVPVLVLPFSVFKSLDVKIGTSYRDFRLFNGAIATVQRMAVPIFAAFLYILLAMGGQDPAKVLLYIALSAVIILFVVFLTAIIYYYVMEATTSADISNKWKIFIPVPLLMDLHKGSGDEKATFPGTPSRDESDLSEISLILRK